MKQTANMTQSTTQHQVVCFGEILWDILPDKSLPGGAPMNVAYHLKKLGINPALITRIGNDDLGQKLSGILEENGVITQYFQMDGKHPTGHVYAKVGEHNEVTYDIVYPVAWDHIRWDDRFETLLEQAKFFVYGSLTSRSVESRNTLYKLLDMAKKKVLDINLRPPNYHRIDVEYLLGKTDILKMNEAELELITGWYQTIESKEDRLKFLQDRFNMEKIIVTLGGDGAMVIDQGTVYRHNGYKVQVADTIGSGDAFLAGFIHQLLTGAPAGRALEFASGLGALIASYSGACPHYQTSEITQMIHSGERQKV
jgi:fructokinase